MTQVNLCPNCQGQGTLEVRGRHILDGYEKVTCTRCEGTGRVQTKSYSVDLPFGKQVDHKLEEQIFELVRRLAK